MTTKILIYVKDGYVQYVNSNNEDVQIVIVDEDQLVNDNKEGFVSEALSPDSIYQSHFDAFNHAGTVNTEIFSKLREINF